jgi:hypothetical protein
MAASAPQDEKQKRDEVVKIVSMNFLEFRRRLSLMVPQELGLIDDLIVTWQSHYVDPKEAADPKVIKAGKVNVLFYTKTPPKPTTGEQTFNSYSIETTISFTSDVHPAIELEAQKKKEEEEAQKKKEADNPAPAAN